MTLERVEHRACFGGWQDVYRHRSSVLDCDMNFAIYLPPQAESGPVPVLYWLTVPGKALPPKTLSLST